MAANKSAFWTGFAKYVANRLLFASCASEPYALTAMMGVLAFLLFVVFRYLAAPSPSTRVNDISARKLNSGTDK